ncbi:MAG: MBL fold metallo-hydrolase [Myxococcales bacterium]|nr:MBL fold metallo-hydrolase [Myxococcales bacterium]MDD9968013.1 MBL fold metallo-hydrolase [Myxococcales bacterium]
MFEVLFAGTGDAFGSGGRFNTCFCVTSPTRRFLIDCGASSMIALKRQKLDPNTIDTVFITHFHADHFGGMPFFVLDAQFFSKRTAPLTVVGPPGLASAYERVMETAFPGSTKTQPKFDLALVEIEPGLSAFGDVTVQAARVIHSPNQKGPCYAYRFTHRGRVIAYTGDTEWTDALVAIAQSADLFIAEAYFYDKNVRLHLTLAVLEKHLPRIQPKRLVLTHMSDDMLTRLPDLPYEAAYDGYQVSL